MTLQTPNRQGSLSATIEKLTTLDEFKVCISAGNRRGLEGILQSALACAQAEQRLSPSELGKLKQDMKLSGPSFSKRVGGIAENKFITNPENWDSLPPCVTTLYELSQIPADTLKKLKTQGKVRPNLEYEQAKALKGGPKRRRSTGGKLTLLCIHQDRVNVSREEREGLQALLAQLEKYQSLSATTCPAYDRLVSEE